MTEQLCNIDIKSLIPHREPFLLVDTLKEYTPNERLVAIKAVTRGEPWFQGHFPDFPVMPGVLITEALAQTCAAFMALEYQSETEAANEDTQAQLYILLRSDVRFPKAVRPGCLLELEVTISEETSAFTVFKVKATQDGKTCVRGNLTVAKSAKNKLVG
ncbi:MAG: 3-hydroxyacyl-[acyl-carrier-protein] dehydratase [Cognaticolwellia sp.]|jgi:3-hydroxyacyl-[acyl-carrier-protein] dehydratase